MNTNANWNYPTAIRVGAGRINELVECCELLGIKAPLIITDRGLSQLPMISTALTNCTSAGLNAGLFSEVKSNPDGENIEQGIAQFNRDQHDGVIAFGGGSALDAGKAIATLAQQSCSIWDIEDIGDNWKNVDADKVVPVIAVPTTAGTGSEVGRAAVITNTNQQRKVIIFHAKMMPECVLLDPNLTLNLPAFLTAATGMDALSHSLEAYCSPLYHPMAEGIAIEGIRLVKDYLPQAVNNGHNQNARLQMLVASTMGATAFQRGLGACHALAHPLGALFDAHHGALNAVLLPYVLRANEKLITERISRLAIFLGLEPDFEKFLGWILSLRQEIGIPETLAGLDIDNSCLDVIGHMAVADPSAATNPIKFNASEYQRIFVAALNGTL